MENLKRVIERLDENSRIEIYKNEKGCKHTYSFQVYDYENEIEGELVDIDMGVR